MRRAGEDQGFALVAALAIMVVIIGLGIALLTFTDNQQSASLREQASETSFDVAEAALNAQIGQLSHSWPATPAEMFTEPCTAATSTATNGCPTTASMSAGYPNVSPIACPVGTPKDPWGSALTNQWTTYVRDDESGGAFNSEVEKIAPSYDKNGNGKLWVRAVGVTQCRVVTVISLITRQIVSLSFPTYAASGSWFHVTNKGGHGGKPIVNTEGNPPVQPGQIGMRCEAGFTGKCEEWDAGKEQIKPDTTKGPVPPNPLQDETQLLGLRSEAIINNTFRSPTVKGCPTKLGELAGLPAYIEGCGNLSFSGNEKANTEAKPGFLVLTEGTIELKGSTEFFGVIYDHNATNLTTGVVRLGGNATVVGAIDVDGPGGVEFGSNGVNLLYSPQALKEVKTYAGATATRNTFRVLPITQ